MKVYGYKPYFQIGDDTNNVNFYDDLQAYVVTVPLREENIGGTAIEPDEHGIHESKYTLCGFRGQYQWRNSRL